MSNPDRNRRPEIHTIGPLTLESESIRVLQNGITLHIIGGGTTEVCRIGIALPGGTAESTRPGLLEAVALMLPEGSEQTPGQRMSDILESNGAWCGSSVTSHHTLINLFCTCSAFPAVLPMAREMAFSPAFEPEAAKRILHLQSSRAAVNRCKVGFNASAALKPIIYGVDNPIAAIPEPEEIITFTPEEMREAHRSRLDTKGIHIFLAGRIDDGMVEAVVRRFASIRTGIEFSPVTLTFPDNVGPEEVVTDMPDALQSAVKMAIPTPGRNDPGFIDMRIAACALGGYFGSRLMTNIREDKGLTYGITAALYGYHDRGYLIVSTETDCANTREVITETVAEIERLKDPASFSPDEVERLRNFFLSNLASVLDSPFQRMDFLQNNIIAGTPTDYFALQHSAIRATTAETIAETARRYFDTSKMVTSIAGKFGGIKNNA